MKKYFLEFLVVFFGILLSFMIDNRMKYSERVDNKNFLLEQLNEVIKEDHDEEDIFKVFDDYVDSSKEKLTKAADNLMKLYKSKDLDEDSRKTLIDFEKKLRMIFKQVDEIDREVEEMARRKRMEDKK